MSLNRATLIGRLGQDPEIRTNSNGVKFATFTLATSETWKDKQTGEKKEQTDWHRIIVSSEGLTEICEKYLRKGTQILAEGRIRTRKYTGQDGVERYVTEIVLGGYSSTLQILERKEGTAAADAAPAEDPAPAGDLDDDIPF